MPRPLQADVSGMGESDALKPGITKIMKYASLACVVLPPLSTLGPGCCHCCPALKLGKGGSEAKRGRSKGMCMKLVTKVQMYAVRP